MRTWYAEGTAAGNVGDFYDNRDGGHSDLNMQPYPQLQRLVYTPQALAARLNWAAQRQVVPGVVFGNSSTSTGVVQGGSNVRSYYTNPRGLALLYQQYTHNNIYIYPEHLDHDPGHNGTPGYGDLYPTNTPYLIASQGSSGSDQSFMRAIPLTLAAFRPEVKDKLVKTGLLMPTLQMILRTCNRQLAAGATTAAARLPSTGSGRELVERSSPKSSKPAANSPYLTGKAHPTVFEGGWVDDLKMIQMAHGIQADSIPPMVQLKVVQDDQPAERLADTPCVMGWVFLGLAQSRKVTISAQDSVDVNKRPLTYSWVLLRGDPARVTIRPLNAENSDAEITVSFQERRAVEPGSPMESNRADIGVFAHNGAYWSAPALATWFFPDDQARTYDESGRPLEIAFGLGQTLPAVTNWAGLLDLLQADTPPAGIVRKGFSPGLLADIEKSAADLRSAFAGVEAAGKKVKDAEAVRQKAAAALKSAQTATARAPTSASSRAADAQAALSAAQEQFKQADAEAASARKELDAANRAAENLLNRKLDGQQTLRQAVEAALRQLLDDQGFYPGNAAAIQSLLASAPAPAKTALEKGRRRLVGYGLLKDQTQGFVLLPVLAGKASSGPAGQLTAFEQALIAQFNGEVLGGLVCPGLVNCTFRRNFVDQRLSPPKNYRDVYHYDALGRRTGLTRYDGNKAAEYSAASMPADTR